MKELYEFHDNIIRNVTSLDNMENGKREKSAFVVVWLSVLNDLEWKNSKL